MVLLYFGTRKREVIPSGLQNAVEWIVEYLLSLVQGVAGKDKGRKFFPLVATFFIFILFCNLLDVFPGVETFGWIDLTALSAAHLPLPCSITYPPESAHLSVRVTGRNTYRNAPPREVPFTRHEAGATTYVELLEAEQLEVRIVEHEGNYSKVFYYAHGQELTEQKAMRVVSTVQRLDSRAASGHDGKLD